MAVPVRKDEQSIPEVLSDLKDLTVAYAKQETVDPIKGLYRYVGFGVVGSLFLAIGVTLFAVGLLRALQTQTGSAFTGNLSWIPYLITIIFLILVAGLAAWATTKDARAHRDREGAP